MKILSIVLFLTLTLGLQAQGKKVFNNKYAAAKELLANGEYEQSMHAFKELTAEHKNNAYTRYAYYYCGYAAFKAGKPADARFILLEVLKKYPMWDKKEEVYYLLSNVLLIEKDTARAHFYIEEIQQKELREQAHFMFQYYEQEVPDTLVLEATPENAVLSSLEEMKAELIADPENEKLAKKIAKKLNKEGLTYQDRLFLEYLIQDYSLDASKYKKGAFKRTEKKDVYNIAIILPFNHDKPKKLHSRLRYYEMLSGVEMAITDLKSQGIEVNYQVYDSKNDTTTVKQILKDEFVMTADMLFGPVFTNNAKLASQFALENEIVYLNPLLADDEITLGNRYTYLNAPSHKQEGIQLAKFGSTLEKPEVFIFYGAKEKDSIRAYTYKKHIEAEGKSVRFMQQVTRSNMNDLNGIMEAQKEEGIDSLSHIYVATESDYAGATIMSNLEEFDYLVPVLAPMKWLNIQLIGNDFEPFRRRYIHFVSHYYLDYFHDQKLNEFRKRMYAKWHTKPVKFEYYSVVGYEAMLFFGKSLNNFGTVISDDLKMQGYQEGVMLQGYHYTSQSNSVVPVYTLDENYNMQLVNKDLYSNGDKK
ncbi:ABC transporter substrate-binding protein [Cyclobacteriaceae bacterium]|nr:ABC transporter substrate-binding protein [Cyclobacteriaceae bacterium]